MPMEIHRSAWQRDFLQLPNALAQDERLSYRARGILVELLSRPGNWQTNADALWRNGQRKRPGHAEGQGAVRNAFAELKAFGYIDEVRQRNSKGHVSTVLHVYDTVGHGRHGGNATPVATSTNTTNQHVTIDMAVSGTSVDRQGEAEQRNRRADSATSVATSENIAYQHVTTDMAVSDTSVTGLSLVRQTTKTEITKTETDFPSLARGGAPHVAPTGLRGNVADDEPLRRRVEAHCSDPDAAWKLCWDMQKSLKNMSIPELKPMVEQFMKAEPDRCKSLWDAACRKYTMPPNAERFQLQAVIREGLERYWFIDKGYPTYLIPGGPATWPHVPVL